MANPGATWLIVNPNAGRKAGLPTNASGCDVAEQALGRQGVMFETHRTGCPGQGAELARAAVAAGVDRIIAAGGDGTVHEIACVLMGSQTTLGILPMGSVMNTARALNIPRDLDQAAALLRADRRVRVDVGCATLADSRAYFLEAASVGLDASVLSYANRLDKGQWRALPRLLRFLVRYAPRRATLAIDGQRQEVQAFTISVAIGPYGGPALTLAPDAKVDDGQFDVVVRERFSRLELLRHMAAIAGGRRSYHPKARTYRGQRVAVRALRHPMTVYADGQRLGQTPVEFSIRPGALSVVVGPPVEGQPSAVSGLSPARAIPVG